MKRFLQKLKRVFSVALSVVLAGTVCLFSSSSTVLAITSLPHIEEIVSSVSNSGSFSVLEIVPKAGTGSIGYYIAGQEPSKDYLGSTLSHAGSQTGRAAATGSFLTKLQNRNLLGSGSGTPLTLSGTAYTEKKPWELSAGDSSAMIKLTLANAEHTTINATFTSASGGDYDKAPPPLASDLSTADQVQVIDYFKYATGTAAGTYYYDPTFTAVTFGDTFPNGTAVYANTATDGLDDQGGDGQGNTVDESKGKPADGHYYEVGIAGKNLTLDKVVPYYIVSSTGQPYASWDASHAYAAVSSDYKTVAKGTGYFNFAGYQYAGAGLGHYAIALGGSDSVAVAYNTVWYSLGYQNNNWFLKYVFNQLETDTHDQTTQDGDLTAAGQAMKVTVKSAAPDKITASDVANAQLIVLSAGFDPASGTELAASYKADDIDAKGTNGLYDAIAAANASEIPIALDSALVTDAGASGTNMAALAAALKNGGTNNFVSKNLYCFAGPLANQDFHTAISPVTGFTDVTSEIENENFLRQKDDPTTADLLDDIVTRANCIRYVINYAGQRQTGLKSKLSVLDLEPGRGQSITSTTVAGWLTGISAANITVTAMPTSEFIGHINDLVETYDMIYVGSSTVGFNVSGGGTTVFNDSTMNGLVYTNVGDTFKSNILLAGLIDRDYYYNTSTGSYPTWYSSTDKKYYKYIDNSSTTKGSNFRFSGNDLTKSKADQLLDFAKSGYPIVFANDLANGSNSNGLVINTSRVDSASYMYTALTSIENYKNVMTVTGINKSALTKYANLSKPSIELQTSPPTYSMEMPNDLTQGSSGGYYLNYTFTIRNQTDSSPKTTTYDCQLFLDQNSDGLYSADEQITDIVIRDSAGKLVAQTKPGGGTSHYTLKADEQYSLSRQMPSDYSGIVPWKLKVVKNDNTYIHASVVDYAHITPQKPVAINILQINSDAYPGASDNSYTLNLQTQLLSSPTKTSYYSYAGTRTVNGVSTTKYFHGLFGKLLWQVSDFDVSITTITATDFNNQSDPNAYLANYNMLIIGFGDMYQELDPTPATAVVDFIQSKKAVLFTHDTTSLSNVPAAYKSNASFRSSNSKTSTPSFSDPALWGYYFNTILRDAVKLDRYGITSSAYRTSLKGLNDGSTLTKTTADALTNAGYSISYLPKSSARDDPNVSVSDGPTNYSVVPEVQGFTNYSLIRYGTGSSTYKATNSNYSSGRTTTTVSQINKGQITTYPYDINTAYFENDENAQYLSQRYMPVSQTHEQYYQLNMNSDNIVVWYCLSNGASGNSSTNYYAPLPNDVVNSYYIYNCGNITYSGMGHFTPSNTADSCYTNGNTTYLNEAELFVNTMIASYRTIAEKPSASFTASADGSGNISSFLLASDYNKVGTGDAQKLTPSGDILDSASKIYFKVANPTLKDNTAIYTQLYYTLSDKNGNEIKDGSGNILTHLLSTDNVPLYNADTGNAVAFNALSGGLIYDIRPTDLINQIKNDGITVSDYSAVNLYINVNSGSLGTLDPSNDAKISIRQIGLFSLK